MDHYNVYESLNLSDIPAGNGAASTLTPLASVDKSLATGNPALERLQFAYVVASPLSNANYWARPADGEHEGTPSTPCNIGSLNADPIASLAAVPLTGSEPLTVLFDASASHDDDDDIVLYEFDFDQGAGWQDYGTTVNAESIYIAAGTYHPQVRVTDDDGASDTAGVEIIVEPEFPVYTPAPDALIAVPNKNEVAVDEAVLVRVISGVPANPLQYIMGVRIVLEGRADYVALSQDLGFPDHDANPKIPVDGIWPAVDAADFLVPPDIFVKFVQENEQWVMDYNITPIGATDAIGTGGDLFNFELSFPSEGIYDLSFVQFDGMKRTFYADGLVNEHYWGDVSNIDPQFSRTINVACPEYTPAPDALIAVPDKNEVVVGEPILLRVITGVPADPLRFVNGVRIAVDGPADYVALSFDIGQPDGNPDAEWPIDGIWPGVAPTTFLVPPDALFVFEDKGGGQWALDASVMPLGGADVAGTGGELFSIRFSFRAAGVYNVSFVEVDGVKRTYYADGAASEYSWGDISNIDPQFSRTITVTE